LSRGDEMTWNKTDKQTGNYNKIPEYKSKKVKGHLESPWFHDWFSGEEIEVNIANYNKADKE